MANTKRRSRLSRSARLITGSSLVLGLVLTGSFGDASSAPLPMGVGQQVANDTGGLSEYSTCAGVASGASCASREQPASTEVQGAMAIDSNFSSLNFISATGSPVSRHWR